MKKDFIRSLIFLIITIFLCYLEILPGLTKDGIFKYYFFDYLSIYFTVTAQSVIKRKDRRAFILYIIGAFFNVLFGYFANSYVLILFALYSSYLFVDSWINWGKIQKIDLTKEKRKNRKHQKRE